MKLYLRSDNVLTKINALYFADSAETYKLLQNTNLVMIY